MAGLLGCQHLIQGLRSPGPSPSPTGLTAYISGDSGGFSHDQSPRQWPPVWHMCPMGDTWLRHHHSCALGWVSGPGKLLQVPELPCYHFLLFLSPMGLPVLFQEHSFMSVHRSALLAAPISAWLGHHQPASSDGVTWPMSSATCHLHCSFAIFLASRMKCVLLDVDEDLSMGFTAPGGKLNFIGK